VAGASAGVDGGPYAVLYIEDNPSNVRLVEQILGRQPAVQRLLEVMRVALVERRSS
jgi:hypothetical protein